MTFIGDDTLIAHNADFDIKFINAELNRIGRSPIEKNTIIDTLILAEESTREQRILLTRFVPDMESTEAVELNTGR